MRVRKANCPKYKGTIALWRTFACIMSPMKRPRARGQLTSGGMLAGYECKGRNDLARIHPSGSNPEVGIRNLRKRTNRMKQKNQGFSMLELLVVIAIIGVIAAFALPSALTFVKGYRLHADASAIAAQLNVTRFRSTSQYKPYRLSVDVAAGSTSRQRLSTTYASPQTEESQLLQRGVRFLATCPVSAKPGSIGSSVTAASSAIYFNTRGLPVDSTGTTYNNNVFYLANDNDLYDAVTVSLGGKVTIWNYNQTTSTWVSR